MALITIPAINVGDEIKESTLNTFVNSVTAVNGNINQENIQDEGIDRRNLALDSIQKFDDTGLYFFKSDKEFEVTFTGNAFGLIRDSNNIDVAVGKGAGIELKNFEFLLITCSFSFRAGHKTGGVPFNSNKGGYEVHFRLVFDDAVANINQDPIPGTERRFNNFLVLDGAQRYHSNNRYSCTIVALIQAQATTSGTNNIRVGLQGRDKYSNDPTGILDGEAFVEEVQMFARVIRR